MFGLGLPEIIIILVIFFVLFGAKRLPQIGEGLGKTMKELRKIRVRKTRRKRKKKPIKERFEFGFEGRGRKDSRIKGSQTD